MNSLPTAPGSVVKFLVQPEEHIDNPEEGDLPMWYVATLIPGAIDADGEIKDAVWASSYIDDPEDKGNVFDPYFILAHAPELVVETFRAEDRPDLVEAVRDSGFQTIGLVAHIREHESEPELTYTFAPGFVNLDSGELEDCMFTNSYGGFHSAEFFESDPVFLYVPDKLI